MIIIVFFTLDKFKMETTKAIICEDKNLITINCGTGKFRRCNLQDFLSNPDPQNLFNNVSKKTDTYQYGQDITGTFVNDKYTAVFQTDGHGDLNHGTLWPYYTIKLLSAKIADNFDDIQRVTFKYNKDRISRLMRIYFREVDKYMREEFPYTKNLKGGGTTCTVNIKFKNPKDPNILCSLTVNAGDSPMFVHESSTEVIKEVTFSHNVDNQEAYRDWCQYAKDLNLEQKECYLGRFNLGNQKIPWMIDSHGNPEPIPIYQREDIDGKVQIKIHSKMKDFYEKAENYFKQYLDIGGIQSFRDRYENLELQKQGVFTPINFGSTLDGKVQNLGGMGDANSRLGTEDIFLANTNVEFIELNKMKNPICYLMCSDGISDVIINEDILECMKEMHKEDDKVEKTKKVVNAIQKKMWERINTIRYGGSNTPLMFATKYGKIYHDDCSFSLSILFPPIKKQKIVNKVKISNNSHMKFTPEEKKKHFKKLIKIAKEEILYQQKIRTQNKFKFIVGNFQWKKYNMKKIVTYMKKHNRGKTRYTPYV